MEMNYAKIYEKIYHLTDHTPSNVDTPKRLGAYLVDWVVGGVLTGLPGVLIYGALTDKSDMFAGLYVFEALGYGRVWAVVTGLLCILFALFYYVYVPLKIYPGQTLGKKWAGFKITKLNGDDVDLKTLLIRQVLCIFILEGAVLVVTNYIRQLTSLTLNFYVDYYWQVFGMIMMVFSGILVLKTDSHRALHDYIAKTKVELVNKSTEDETPVDFKKGQNKTVKQDIKVDDVKKTEKVNSNMKTKEKHLPKKSKVKKK